MPRLSDLCSHVGTSFVEPGSNWSTLDRFEFEKDLNRLFEYRFMSEEQFCVVLHELVHHWTFHSAVGAALGVLSYQIHKSATENDVIRFTEFYFRYEIIARMLRPLAEGLAFFAEFDCWPAEKVESPILRFIELTMAPKEALEKPRSSDTLTKLLIEYRSKDSTVERKEQLLSDPIRPESKGHLLGYLAVKNIWNYLIQERHIERLFRESDLFLSFLRSYFWDDLEFVEIILGMDVVGEEWYVTVAKHFESRVKNLFQISEENFAALEQWMIEETIPFELGHSTVDLCRSIDVSLDGALAGEMALMAACHESPLLMEFLAQRELFCLASLKCPVLVKENGRFFIGDLAKVMVSRDTFVETVMAGHEPIGFGGSAINGACQGNGIGNIEFFYSLSRNFRVTVVSLDSKPVAIEGVYGSARDEVEKQVWNWFHFAHLHGNKIRKRRDEVESYLPRFSEEPLREHCVNSVDSQTFEALVTLAFLYTEDLETLRTKAQDDGVLGLLGDLQLFKNFVKFSLILSTSCGDVQIARKYSSLSDTEFKKMIDGLEQITQKLKVPFLIGNEHYMWCFI